MLLDINFVVAIIINLIFAITFIQSGLDKLINHDDNLNWFDSIFNGSFISKLTMPLFWTLTVQELLAGICFLISAVFIYLNINYTFIHYTGIFGLILLLQLFFGQRVAKDYVGASGILPYVILIVVYFYLIAQ